MAAIYMWVDDEVKILLTTTLYPVDIADSLEISAAMHSANMSPIPLDDFDQSHALISTSYAQLRWFLEDGPYFDEFDQSHALISASYVQLRWFDLDGPYFDAIDQTHALISITHTVGRVFADTPDEELQLTTTINSTCTMDAV